MSTTSKMIFQGILQYVRHGHDDRGSRPLFFLFFLSTGVLRTSAASPSVYPPAPCSSIWHNSGIASADGRVAMIKRWLGHPHVVQRHGLGRRCCSSSWDFFPGLEKTEGNVWCLLVERARRYGQAASLVFARSAEECRCLLKYVCCRRIAPNMAQRRDVKS